MITGFDISGYNYISQAPSSGPTTSTEQVLETFRSRQRLLFRTNTAGAIQRANARKIDEVFVPPPLVSTQPQGSNLNQCYTVSYCIGKNGFKE